MDYEENMSMPDSGMDEAADEEESYSEDYEEEDTSESLDSLNEDEEGEYEESDEEPAQSQGTSEPGYVQRRIEKALARERDSIRAEMEAMYAPMRERLIEMDAQDLVRKGVVKDIETAKELVRYRNGQQAPAPAPEPAEQPRNDRGQFAPKEDPATSTRIDMLAYQADKIRDQTGVDVIAEFANNEDIKQQIISGKMDFYDLAEMMQANQRKRPPAPTRSSNGATNHTPNAIENMSDEQFQRMERRIKEGARYSLR